MEINRAAFGALAVIGVVAAGGGAYLANRHNETVIDAITHRCIRPRCRVWSRKRKTASRPHLRPRSNAWSQRPLALKELKRLRNRRSGRPTPFVARRRERHRLPSVREQRSSRRRLRLPTPARRSIRQSPPRSSRLDSTTVERTPAVQEPPRKMYDELVIPADSVIGLQVENAVSSDRAKIEDYGSRAGHTRRRAFRIASRFPRAPMPKVRSRSSSGEAD